MDNEQHTLETLRAARRQAKDDKAKGKPGRAPTTAAAEKLQTEKAAQRFPCIHRGAQVGHLQGCKCSNPPALFECFAAEREGADCIPLHEGGTRERAAQHAGVDFCNGCLFRSPPGPSRRLQWAVGITAAKRPNEPTLAKTVASLDAAGWPASSVLVFADGDDVPDIPEECPRVVRSTRAGALSNFMAAAAELLARFPMADAYLIAQDDVAFCKGVREYVENKPWPADAGLVKLFTDANCEGKAKGWGDIPHQYHMRGAQAYVFPRGYLERLLASPEILKQRRGRVRPNEAIDNVVARWARTEGVRQVCHTPSLSTHTAETNSTLAHRMQPARSFPGEDFDARNYAPTPPAVTAIMVTGHKPERRPLAHVAIDSFHRQTYANRRLLIINDGPRAILEDYEPAQPEWADADNVVELVIEPGRTLGELRNYAIEEAATPLVIQWDDDDYALPGRIAEQVAAWRPGTAVCLGRQLRVDLETGHALRFARRQGIEGTILHERETPARYPAQAKGEDTVFYRHWIEAGRLQVLDNDPTLYVRTYHGANTWDRAHVMKGEKCRRSDALLLDRVRLLYPAHPMDRWTMALPQIHGWSSPRIAKLLTKLLDHQAERMKLQGDVLEIGIHHGRTMLGLAAAAHDHGSRVVAVDPYENLGWHDSPNDERMTAGRDRRRIMEKNARLVFGRWPKNVELLAVDSRELTADDYRAKSTRPQNPTPYRFAHIDGDHAYDPAAHDIEQAAAIVAPRGVVAVDDIFNTRWPAVAPAFWERWREWGFVPFAFVDQRLLCALDKDAAAEYFDVVAGMPGRQKVADIAGHPVSIYPQD